MDADVSDSLRRVISLPGFDGLALLLGLRGPYRHCHSVPTSLASRRLLRHSIKCRFAEFDSVPTPPGVSELPALPDISD